LLLVFSVRYLASFTKASKSCDHITPGENGPHAVEVVATASVGTDPLKTWKPKLLCLAAWVAPQLPPDIP